MHVGKSHNQLLLLIRGRFGCGSAEKSQKINHSEIFQVDIML